MALPPVPYDACRQGRKQHHVRRDGERTYDLRRQSAAGAALPTSTPALNVQIAENSNLLRSPLSWRSRKIRAGGALGRFGMRGPPSRPESGGSFCMPIPHLRGSKLHAETHDDCVGGFLPVHGVGLSFKKTVSLAAAMSPADTLCFDIFSPPHGDSDVISQVERLSSNETKRAPRLVRIAVGSSRW
jgi:hypothetical protein